MHVQDYCSCNVSWLLECTSRDYEQHARKDDCMLMHLSYRQLSSAQAASTCATIMNRPSSQRCQPVGALAAQNNGVKVVYMMLSEGIDPDQLQKSSSCKERPNILSPNQ